MKADQVLIEHHDVLRGLLTQLEETTDEQGKERKKLLDDLVSELGVHVRIEDELFYPAVEKVTPLLAISQAEHRAIDDQLAVVLRTDTGGPDFATEVKMLAATLHHHAGEEALEALGMEMQERKKQLENSTVTQTLRKAKREVLRRV